MRQVNIHEALNGHEVIIAKGDRHLVTLKPLPGNKRRLDGAKGKILMAEDFNAPLEDFKDYM